MSDKKKYKASLPIEDDQEKMMAAVAIKTAELSAMYYESKIKELKKISDKQAIGYAIFFLVAGVILGKLW